MTSVLSLTQNGLSPLKHSYLQLSVILQRCPDYLAPPRLDFVRSNFGTPHSTVVRRIFQ